MLDPIDSSSHAFLLAMDQLNKRLDRAQRLVSSGKRIDTASDSPDEIGELLSVRGDIARNQQMRTNLASYKLETDIASNALEQASNVLNSVKSLTATGWNATMSPAMQTNLVQAIEGFMQDMVGIANTQVNGRYLFSGDKDQSAAYALDLTRANGVSAYGGTASTREAESADGSTFAVAKQGDELFDSSDPGASVFTALANLRAAILANNPHMIESALSGIQSAQDHIHTEAVFYGLAQKRISKASDEAANRDQQLQTQLSSIENADIMAGILELQDALFQRQAALAARAKAPPTSLFDYLKG